MALIILVAVMAIALLRAYTHLEATNPEDLAKTVRTVRQVAGVIFAFAKAIYDLLSALQGQRPQGSAPTPSAQSWGSSPRVVSGLAGPHG